MKPVHKYTKTKDEFIIVKKTLDNIDNTPELEDINDKLKDSEYLIEYLDHVVKIFSFLDNSIKNIIECEKLQQL